MKLKHEIYNPNSIVLNLEKYFVIPFGPRCTSAMITKFACLRKFSLPFDWCAMIYPQMIKDGGGLQRDVVGGNLVVGVRTKLQGIRPLLY